MIHEGLGEYLREKRLQKNLGQADVAKKLGYSSSQFVSNFERGLCSPPLPKIKILMQLYGISLNEMTKILLDFEKQLILATLSRDSTNPRERKRAKAQNT